MAGIPIKRGNVDTDTHRIRTPCKHKGRDWGVTSISQGTSKIASKTSEVRNKAWNIPSLIAFWSNLPCQHLDFSLLTCTSLGKLIQSVYVCVCVCVQIHTQKVQWYGLPLGRETGGTENFHLQSSYKLPLPTNRSLYIQANKSSLQETTFITEKITKSCQSITFRYQYALTSGAKSDPHEGLFLRVLSWQWYPGPHWAQRRGGSTVC